MRHNGRQRVNDIYLPPLWLGFDSQIRRHMWVEFVGSLLCSENISPVTTVSPFLKNQHLT